MRSMFFAADEFYHLEDRMFSTQIQNQKEEEKGEEEEGKKEVDVKDRTWDGFLLLLVAGFSRGRSTGNSSSSNSDIRSSRSLMLFPAAFPAAAAAPDSRFFGTINTVFFFGLPRWPGLLPGGIVCSIISTSSTPLLPSPFLPLLLLLMSFLLLLIAAVVVSGKPTTAATTVREFNCVVTSALPWFPSFACFAGLPRFLGGGGGASITSHFFSSSAPLRALTHTRAKTKPKKTL